MLLLENPQTAEQLANIGIAFDRRNGRFSFKGQLEFFFDFATHAFTAENRAPDTCFPVFSSDRSFGEELMAAFVGQVEQYLIKDISNKQAVESLLAELRKTRCPVGFGHQFSEDRQVELFDHLKKRYELILLVLVCNYNKRIKLAEKSLISVESLIMHLSESIAMDEGTKHNLKLSLFVCIYETMNTMKHPLMLEHRTIYDSKVKWPALLASLVQKMV